MYLIFSLKVNHLYGIKQNKIVFFQSSYKVNLYRRSISQPQHSTKHEGKPGSGLETCHTPFRIIIQYLSLADDSHEYYSKVDNSSLKNYAL